MSSVCVRKSEATFFGWRINQGSVLEPKWLAVGGAPKGYSVGGKVLIQWMQACDDFNDPILGAPERPANTSLLAAISDLVSCGEALLEIEGTFYRFGQLKKSAPAHMIPLEFAEEHAHMVATLKKLIDAERKGVSLILELGASLAHKYGGW